MVWGDAEKTNWFRDQHIQRAYKTDIVEKILALKDRFEVSQYGALSANPELYPVYLVKTKSFDPSKRTILITGGVHGYETSGVYGALGFMRENAADYEKSFNFVCAPCISPWSFETINRWNSKAIDPNRSFRKDSPAEESRLFVEAVAALKTAPYAHIDLHETTDTDNSVFRPALEQRDGIAQEFSEIPDGFYLVGDSLNPQPAFQKAIIDEVRKVTHIAPADENGKLIGAPLEQEGVINYPIKELFLCTGVTAATYTTTTEVYPDSPKATPEICVQAQIAAIRGALDYLASQSQ